MQIVEQEHRPMVIAWTWSCQHRHLILAVLDETNRCSMPRLKRQHHYNALSETPSATSPRDLIGPV